MRRDVLLRREPFLPRDLPALVGGQRGIRTARAGTCALRRLTLRTNAVILFMDHALLVGARVSVPRVSALVDRQRRPRRHGAPIPAVPSAPSLLPRTAPVLAPVRRRVAAPSSK